MELSLLGERLQAETALQWGSGQQSFVTIDALADEAGGQWLTGLAQGPTLALGIDTPSLLGKARSMGMKTSSTSSVGFQRQGGGDGGFC